MTISNDQTITLLGHSSEIENISYFEILRSRHQKNYKCFIFLPAFNAVDDSLRHFTACFYLASPKSLYSRSIQMLQCWSDRIQQYCNLCFILMKIRLICAHSLLFQLRGCFSVVKQLFLFFPTGQVQWPYSLIINSPAPTSLSYLSTINVWSRIYLKSIINSIPLSDFNFSKTTRVV